jgi:hypothetical protein
MAVTVLDLITGSVRPLSQLTGIAANVMTFEMQAGGTRSLAAIIAQPDLLKLFDMTSKASLTYNQALAADGGGVISGYDVFVLAGQSNMVGRNGPIDTTLDATDSRIQMYGFDAQAVALAADPLDHQDETANTIGMGLTFAKQYIAAGLLAAGRQILLVPVAKGATAFGTGFWRAGGGGDAPAIARTKAAMTQGSGTNTLKGILWHQGEGDQAVSQAQYEADLDTLIARWRSGMTGATATTPFIVGGLMPSGGQTGAGVSAALSATTTRTTRTGYAASISLTSGGDNIHFDAPSIRTLAGRYFTAYQSAQSNTVAPHVPSAVPGLVATGVTGGQTVLTWNAPSNGGSPVTDYLVEYKAQSSSTWLTFADGVSTALTATITGLTDGTLYDTRVSAINAIGTGAPSAVVATGTLTNLIPSPQAFNSWTQTGVTVTQNVTGTADRLTEDTATNSHNVASPQGSAVTTGTTYTIAVDATYENLPFIQLHLPTGLTNQAWANFDIQNGVLGTVGPSTANSTITSKGAGVWRITMTFVCPVDGFAQMVAKGAASASVARGASYLGTGKTVLFDNGQFVAGPTAGFYP